MAPRLPAPFLVEPLVEGAVEGLVAPLPVVAGALILAGALPGEGWIAAAGLISLWGAAVLTLMTGWDYLRVGLKHMD